MHCTWATRGPELDPFRTSPPGSGQVLFCPSSVKKALYAYNVSFLLASLDVVNVMEITLPEA